MYITSLMQRLSVSLPRKYKLDFAGTLIRFWQDVRRETAFSHLSIRLLTTCTTDWLVFWLEGDSRYDMNGILTLLCVSWFPSVIIVRFVSSNTQHLHLCRFTDSCPYKCIRILHAPVIGIVYFWEIYRHLHHSAPWCGVFRIPCIDNGSDNLWLRK